MGGLEYESDLDFVVDDDEITELFDSASETKKIVEISNHDGYSNGS